MSTEQGIDTLAKEQLNLKTELSTLKDSLENEKTPSPQTTDDLHTVQEFLDHYHSCDKDDCEIHQKIDKGNKEWLLKGIALGKRI